MHWLKRKNLLIYFTFLHIFGYYIWIYYWRNNDFIKTLGGNIFSTLAPIIASFTLFFVYRRLQESDRHFWLLLFFGCISYAIGEVTWIYYESILQIEIPFPGLPSLFYMLQFVFYLLAFSYRMWCKRVNFTLIKSLFNTCIIMTVLIAFSWDLIITDMIELYSNTNLKFFLSIGFPIGDLLLLLGTISLYFGSGNFFSTRVLYLIMASLVVQVIGDFAYLFSSTKNIDISGGQFDPLWPLAIFLLAIAGENAVEDIAKGSSDEIVKQSTTSSMKDFVTFKLLLPYMNRFHNAHF